MPFKEKFAVALQQWKPLTIYQKFEHAVILVLTALIAIVVAFAPESRIENLVQHRFFRRVRSDRIFSVPGPVWDDLHRHHCTRIQTLVVAGSGAPTWDRPGSHRDLDRAARHRPQADNHRSIGDGCSGGVCTGHGDPGPRRGILASSRSGQARAGLKCSDPRTQRLFSSPMVAVARVDESSVARSGNPCRLDQAIDGHQLGRRKRRGTPLQLQIIFPSRAAKGS